MPKAYSIDLRSRVVAFVEADHSCHAAAAHFGVSVSSVVKWSQRYRATGSVAPGKMGGRRHAKLEPHRVYVLERVSEKADITMPELAEELAARGTCVAPASLSRWLIRQGYRFKKNSAGQRTRASRRQTKA